MNELGFIQILTCINKLFLIQVLSMTLIWTVWRIMSDSNFRRCGIRIDGITLPFDKHPDLPEGNLTKMRATIVCEPSLVIFANKIELNQLILLGKGEEKRVGEHALH